MNSNNLIAFFLTLKSIDSYNYPQEVYRFLNDKSLINYADTDGKTPLHIVAERGNVTLCIHLLKEGAFITKDNYGKTPVDYAIQNGWGRCACLILEKKMERDLIFQKKIEREKNNPFNPPRVLKRGEPLPPQQPKIEVIFSKTPFSDIPQSSIDQSAKEPTLKDRINASNLPENFKKQAFEKEGSLSCNFGASASKDKEWIETLLKLPINNFSSLPVSKKDTSIDDIKTYFKTTTEKLDEVAYGMDNVKEEIIDCISQMISTNNSAMPRVICLQGSAGTGKCLAKGTKILMFDGSLKNVEDIQVGDVIMGDDSTRRNVLALGRGKDQMYKIDDVKGETYTVNSEHILTLIYSHSKRIHHDKNRKRYSVQWFDNEDIAVYSKVFIYNNKVQEEVYEEAKKYLDSINENKVCDISIKEYLQLDKGIKLALKGLYTKIDFDEKELDFDPYILGLWLGDGSKIGTCISNQDASILKYLSSTLNKYNCYLQYNSNYDYRINSCDTSRKEGVNYMLNVLRKHNLINNKHIPNIYKCNSRENRLKLLAGLIDSDGYLDYSKTGFEITQCVEHENLINDIQYLCRSLGFSCVKNQKKTSWTYKGIKNIGLAWRIYISGYGLHEVPTLVPRKKANERLQIKNALVSGITVTPVNYDDYYGFEIDGNKRFVLGNFIVTHNTSIIRNGVSKVLNRPFHQINMGGISDADYLIGHESTYVSSKPGMIVQSLINSKVMNPVIFMDEIDKISKTEKGDDIQSVLIHLTDPIQNSDFQDKYFSGLSIDISKVLFIFSCNDDSKISPILKDRLNIIRVKEPTVNDKAVIGKKYILKELIPNIGLNEIDIEEEDVKYIINKYCKEDVGLRSLKKCIETILMKINTASYTPSKYKSLKNISFPLKITQKIIDEVIVKKEDKNSEFMNSMFI